MNLGQAVAVCLYEIARTPMKGVKRAAMKRGGAKEENERATVGAAEMISELLLENLRKSGYVKPGNDAMVVKKVRRLVLRLDLKALDAKILLGMVRQIAWKLKQAEK
jgi:tRNA/rRNA methyltransferase